MATPSAGHRFAGLPVTPPVEPMPATLARTLPVADHYYEPKWDGFRCVAFRSGSGTMLQSRNQRPLDRYFPELAEGLRASVAYVRARWGDRRGRSQRAALRRPDGEASPLNVAGRPVATRDTSLFVAFDLLAVGDTDLRTAPAVERRARLVELLAGAHPGVVATPATDDSTEAASWLERFSGGGIDGVVAKAVAGAVHTRGGHGRWSWYTGDATRRPVGVQLDRHRLPSVDWLAQAVGPVTT